MNSENVLEVVYKTIKKYNMIEDGDGVIVGISGGPDSLCLLHLLYKLKDNFGISLYAAHVNHKLRGKSADDDEEFVKKLSQSFNIPVFTKSIEIKTIAKKEGMTLEEAGRKARYSYFYEIMKNVKADKIAVGHNMNDNAETLLFNILRGSGLDGLKGIEPVRDNIIRPLIKLTREEIEFYCKENSLNPRIDESNAQTIFTRNKIRLDLIPYLKESFNPNIIQVLNRTAEVINDENEFLNTILEKYYSDCCLDFNDHTIRLSLEKFNGFHTAVKRRVLRMAVQKIKGGLKSVDKIHIEQAIKLSASGKTGKSIKIPGGIVIEIEYKGLVIKLKTEDESINYSYPVPIPGEIEIPELKAKLKTKILKVEDVKSIDKNKFICIIDDDKLNMNLSVHQVLNIRNRRKGDVINPLGMKGSKKLKEFFIDEKIPRDERVGLPLIAAGNEIVWVVGKRYSEKFKISNETKEVVVLEYMFKG